MTFLKYQKELDVGVFKTKFLKRFAYPCRYQFFSLNVIYEKWGFSNVIYCKGVPLWRPLCFLEKSQRILHNIVYCCNKFQLFVVPNDLSKFVWAGWAKAPLQWDASRFWSFKGTSAAFFWEIYVFSRPWISAKYLFAVRFRRC